MTNLLTISEVQEQLHIPLEDRLIDDREREQVKSAIQKLRRKMAELEVRLNDEKA